MPELSFRELYDEHFRFVWRTLRQLGVREEDTPDAAQEVFVVVHRKLPEFGFRSKVTTWLFSICFRVARDRRRLRQVMRAKNESDCVDECVDEECDVNALVERREMKTLLESILDEMPLPQRAVFVCYELEGMEGEEIAAALELPLGTVYSRLRLAREVFERKVSRLRAKQMPLQLARRAI